MCRYAYVCLYVYIYIYICVSIQIFGYIYMCAFTYVCLYTYVNIYMCAYTFVCLCCCVSTRVVNTHVQTFIHMCVKLIAFELAAKFSRPRGNPVQPRLYNAQNAIFKRLKTGFSLRSRSSPVNSNAISFRY